METIIVKEFKKCPSAKGDLMVIKINGNRKATLAPWEKKEQTFIENEVGELGCFDGDIVTDGDYTNIKNIKFDSAKKTNYGAPVEKVATMPPPIQPETQQIETVKPTVKLTSLLTPKDACIVAQVILKEASNNVTAHAKAGLEVDQSKYGEWLCDNVRELTGAYKLALDLLHD